MPVRTPRPRFNVHGLHALDDLNGLNFS